MRNIAFLASLGTLASGCIVYDDFASTPVPRRAPGPAPGGDCCYNAPPEFLALGAEIFVADRPSGDRLFVSAEVYDPDYDVVDVWVEVYDDYDYEYADVPLSVFSLVPDAAGVFWDAAIPLVDAGIDPYYADVYSVDFVVEDTQGIGDVVNVLPDLTGY